MATYPNNIFSPREKQNRSGVEYDPEKKTVIFVEDIKKLDDEVVAIEEELGLHFKRDRMDPNLVLYLPFEENTGTMTKDLSGWGNHGALINGPSWTNGKVGKCLSFDGANDYVNCGDGVSLKIGEPLTIEVWTKRQPGTPNDVKIVGNYHPDIKGYIMQSYNGDLSFGFSNGSGYINYNFGGDYRDGQWHHFVITKDSNYIRAYIDGNAQTPVNETRLIVPSDYGLGIGVGSNVWTSFPFNGLIDDVRIYNRALTASEIQDHYLNP